MNIHLICDLVFMVGGFILALSLVFSIKRRVRMPTATTIPAAIVLTAFVACFILLELYLSAFSAALTAACWYVLYFMRKGGTV